jgi:hypothetical protein
MINKLISKHQVRLLEYEGCQSDEYVRGYTRAINDVLELEQIPTLGVDELFKIRNEVTMLPLFSREAVVEIIDKYMKGEA